MLQRRQQDEAELRWDPFDAAGRVEAHLEGDDRVVSAVKHADDLAVAAAGDANALAAQMVDAERLRHQYPRHSSSKSKCLPNDSQTVVRSLENSSTRLSYSLT